MEFKVKVRLAANETFGAWREGTHDDLVLAVALTVWSAERNQPAMGQAVAGGFRQPLFSATGRMSMSSPEALLPPIPYRRIYWPACWLRCAPGATGSRGS